MSYVLLDGVVDEVRSGTLQGKISSTEILCRASSDVLTANVTFE